ncbi:MAG: hypothetical protein E6Q97_35785 [Desulfurellales bacterium]|nr:MAG: hypothetical protein E6Q97_35785 [Desulfurellales bacterium]
MSEVTVFETPLKPTPRTGGSWAKRFIEYSATIGGACVRITQTNTGRWRGQVVIGANVIDAGHSPTTDAASKAVEGLILTWRAALSAVSKAAVAVVACVLLGCSTPDAPAETRDTYYERGLALGKANDEAGVAIEWARLKNPVGENATMTVEERAAALRNLFEGWKAGKQ